MISPVFDEQGIVLFYVASRGHHADIGGITPGSMPPFSRHVDEEGVLMNNIKIVDEGVFLEAEIRELLASGQYPARNADANIADLKAQLAANEKGVQELRRIVSYFVRLKLCDRQDLSCSSRQQTADSRQQAAGSRQQAAGSMEQTADSIEQRVQRLRCQDL